MTTSQIKSETITVTPLHKPLGCGWSHYHHTVTMTLLLNEDDHKAIWSKVLTYLVVVIPGQGNFSPKSQYKFNKIILTLLFERWLAMDMTNKILANEKVF